MYVYSLLAKNNIFSMCRRQALSTMKQIMFRLTVGVEPLHQLSQLHLEFVCHWSCPVVTALSVRWELYAAIWRF